MAVKKPLVLYSGGLEELRSGDTISGATAGGMNTGTAVIDFGATPQSLLTTDLAVAGILTTSSVHVEISYLASADRSADEHLIARLSLAATVPVNGTLRVIAHPGIGPVRGKFNIKYSWS